MPIDPKEFIQNERERFDEVLRQQREIFKLQQEQYHTVVDAQKEQMQNLMRILEQLGAVDLQFDFDTI